MEQRRELLVERHMRRGERMGAERQHELSARELALAHALAPSSSRLACVANALRRADLDREALLVYRRLLQDAPPAEQAEFAEAVALLRAKLGADAEDSFESASLLRTLQERAHALCQKASFVECGAHYAIAYALKPLPRLLFNIAQASRRASLLDESVLFYRRFQQESPPSPLSREAAQYVSELRTEAFRPPLYKRWWLWGAVLGGAAAVAAVSTTAVLTSRRSDPQTDLGTKEVVFSLSF